MTDLNVTFRLSQDIDPDLLTYPVDMIVLPPHLRTLDKFPRSMSDDYREMKDWHVEKFEPPDQMNRLDDEFLPLNYTAQWMIFEACNLRAYNKRYDSMNKLEKEKARAEWLSLVWDGTAFTNGTSYESGYECFVTGKNKNSPRGGIQWESIVCSMNILRVLGKPEMKHSKYLGKPAKNYPHVPVEVININKRLPTAEEFLSKYWVCHKPTISTKRYLGDGKFQMIYFPQFREEAVTPVLGKKDFGWFRWDWLGLPNKNLQPM